MIAIKLREAMEAYKRRTGKRMTYEILSRATGIGHGTLRTIGSRDDYNATLELVEKLCRALDVPLHDMLEMIDDPPKAKRGAAKKR
jgi:DNA-binding Xre family transcriptional regulator